MESFFFLSYLMFIYSMMDLLIWQYELQYCILTRSHSRVSDRNPLRLVDLLLNFLFVKNLIIAFITFLIKIIAMELT